MAVAPLRPQRRGLLYLALLSLGCRATHQQPTLPAFSDAVHRELGARNGALLIFDPRSCTLSAETTHLLNSVAQRRPLAVRGVMTLIPEDSVSLRKMQDLLGLRFTSRADTAEIWRRYVVQMGLTPPVIVVVKAGSIHAVLSGSTAANISNELPGLGRIDFETEQIAPSNVSSP